MVWMMGHYPDCNSGPPCLVVDDYKKKHNFAAYLLIKNWESYTTKSIVSNRDNGIMLEKDQHLFWNLLNRNKGRKNRISELVANGSTYRTPKEITKVWSDYFQDLYTPKANDSFDDDHKCFVEQSIVTMLTASHTNYKHTIDDDITYDEVWFAIKSLKRNKACSFDSIANEHLIHGGAIVCSHLMPLSHDRIFASVRRLMGARRIS